MEYQETVEILQTKVKKLEQLVELKDKRIDGTRKLVATTNTAPTQSHALFGSQIFRKSCAPVASSPDQPVVAVSIVRSFVCELFFLWYACGVRGR